MKWLLAFAIFFGLMACHHRGPHRGPHPDHKVVVVEKGHVHDHNCGHYHHGGKVYHHPGHVHGHGCGHKLVDGLWHLIDD